MIIEIQARPVCSNGRTLTSHADGLASAFLGLVVWAFLGLLGLVLQTLVVFKDPLATYHPRLKPLLLEACQFVGCQILPLQKTDAVVIDFSSVDAMPADPAQEILAMSAQPK